MKYFVLIGLFLMHGLYAKHVVCRFTNETSHTLYCMVTTAKGDIVRHQRLQPKHQFVWRYHENKPYDMLFYTQLKNKKSFAIAHKQLPACIEKYVQYAIG